MMLTVQTDSGEIQVWFRHENPSKKIDSFGYVPCYTECRIFDGDGNEVSYGVAHCNPKDNFSKSFGRKLSLTRALEYLYPGTRDTDSYNKGVRAQVWEAYHEKCG